MTSLANMPAYTRGNRVNMEEWNAVSRVLESAVQLAFGVPVARGTKEKGCIAPVGAGECIGISQACLTLPHEGDYYEQYDTVSVVEVGVIAVVAGGVCTAGAPAYYNSAANGGAGGWGNAGGVLIPGAQFSVSGVALDTVTIRYRRPVPVA